MTVSLEKEGRAELQRSGWCEALRESLRAAKKRRLGQLWPREIADRALLRLVYIYVYRNGSEILCTFLTP